MTGQRPIGWWVKRLDELLEQVVDHALADDGLSRRHWQVLHALGPGGMHERDLGGTLAPFGGAVELPPVLTELTGRGWVTRGAGGRLEHTAAGRAADERLLGRIAALRRQVTDGLSAEEYERTVAALARMVGNVERALGLPGPPRDGGS
jgi:DNA-binding MarR family transcriptional regulator